jgi:hypothetical protein
VLSGSKQGTARITFNADNTLTGIQIRYSRAAASPPDDNPRGGGSEDRTSGPSSGGGTNAFGGSNLMGEWGYGANGKSLVGYIAEVSMNKTNETSFTGTVRPGRSLSLKVSGDTGTHTVRGVTNGTTTDISGDYAALGRQGSVSFTEFLNLANTGPGDYDVTGTGPGYDLTGFVMLVRQNHLGLYLERMEGSNIVVTAASGPWNSKKGTASLKGVNESGRVTYKLVPQ